MTGGLYAQFIPGVVASSKKNAGIAYPQYLGVGTHLVNHDSEEMYVKVDLCSNVEWTATSSEEWLKVATQLYWTAMDTFNLVMTTYVSYTPYSGLAPDIGAFEYLDVMVAGQDSAFLYLIAEENIGEHRTAVVSVQGEGVPGYSQIVVNQYGTGEGVPGYSQIVVNQYGTGEGVPGYSQIVVNQYGTGEGMDEPKGKRDSKVFKMGRKLYIDRQTGK
ncbi:MAG: hypothetical protein RBT61_00425 [Candidatus Kapabacteria bacterium]|nr:hypothetical protein [Candidatus Kapabacteria bacterium]